MLKVALQVLIVFAAAVFIDIFYSLWFRFSTRGWEHRAALMSTLCGGAGLLGAWMIISSAGSEWYAIPDLLGLYVGTIVGLRFSRWLEARWDNELSEKEQRLKKVLEDVGTLKQEIKILRASKTKQKPPPPKRPLKG